MKAQISIAVLIATEGASAGCYQKDGESPQDVA
ncbi:uncharacterized protein FTOL_13758 [Fusarium torulosum]|uniref:Uncharacterized protein n=1 Tax=Fusarium torulosum TaxID=33205 RepID=A0AAE8SQ57_9HYPO|nr:uncharacterized protein FTOL_13758 [Fusarium torulosum]